MDERKGHQHRALFCRFRSLHRFWRPTTGAPVFEDDLFKELENIYGGMWDMVVDPIEHAHAIIAHIDKKRKALGIDKARERILMDMADRQKLETA